MGTELLYHFAISCMDVVAFPMEDEEARVEATIVVGVGTSEAEASVAMS